MYLLHFQGTTLSNRSLPVSANCAARAGSQQDLYTAGIVCARRVNTSSVLHNEKRPAARGRFPDRSSRTCKDVCGETYSRGPSYAATWDLSKLINQMEFRRRVSHSVLQEICGT